MNPDITMEYEIKIEAVAELTVAIEIERHPEDPEQSQSDRGDS